MWLYNQVVKRIKAEFLHSEFNLAIMQIENASNYILKHRREQCQF